MLFSCLMAPLNQPLLQKLFKGPPPTLLHIYLGFLFLPCSSQLVSNEIQGEKVWKAKTVFKWWRKRRNGMSKSQILFKEQRRGKGWQHSYINTFAPFKSLKGLDRRIHHLLHHCVFFLWTRKYSSVSWNAVLLPNSRFIFTDTGTLFW